MNIARLDVTHDRHDEAVVGLSGDADIDVLVTINDAVAVQVQMFATVRDGINHGPVLLARVVLPNLAVNQCAKRSVRPDSQRRPSEVAGAIQMT